MTRRWTRVAIAALVAVLGIGALSVSQPVSAAPATSISDLRKQIDELEAQQQELATQRSAAQERLTAAQKQLASTQAQIDAQKAQMAGLQAQIVQIALQQFQDRGLNTTALLMTSATSDDLLGSFTVMQQVTDTANSLVTSLQLQQATLNDLVAAQEAAVSSIETEKAHLDDVAKQTEAKIAESKELLDELVAAAKAAAEAAAREAALAAARKVPGANAVSAGAGNATGVAPVPSGSLRSPLSSYVVTSAYGMRVHPISGLYRFHDGIDLAVSCGTPIHAPGNGLVLDYYWADSYGNRLVLDLGTINGHHIVASFNHLSADVAKPGADVSQGDTIALVGTTGDSTGCHLHYMIWSDGQVINPTPYV